MTVATILAAVALAGPPHAVAHPPTPAHLIHVWNITWTQILQPMLPRARKPILDYEHPVRGAIWEAAANPGIIWPSYDLLAIGSQRENADAASTLIHEAVHALQSDAAWDGPWPVWKSEGGAEAFARLCDRRIAAVFGVYPDEWAYTGWAERVLRVLGRRWVLRGQFR